MQWSSSANMGESNVEIVHLCNVKETYFAESAEFESHVCEQLTHFPTAVSAIAATSATIWGHHHHLQTLPLAAVDAPTTAVAAPTAGAPFRGAAHSRWTRYSPPPQCLSRCPAQSPCRTSRASRSIRDATSATDPANCPCRVRALAVWFVM